MLVAASTVATTGIHSVASPCETRGLIGQAAILSPTEDAFEFAHHEVDDLVVVGAQVGVGLHLREGVVDDGEEHAHQPDVDDADVQEEEHGSHDAVRVLERLEVEVAESEGEEGLEGAGERAVVGQLAAEQQVPHEAEGGVVDEERDAEHLQVLRRQLDRVAQHAHAPVKLEHLDELDRRHEDDAREHQTEHLVPDRDRHEVHVVACNSHVTRVKRPSSLTKCYNMNESECQRYRFKTCAQCLHLRHNWPECTIVQ